MPNYSHAWLVLQKADVLRHSHARLLGAGRHVDDEPGGGMERYANDHEERPPPVTSAQVRF